MKRQAGALLPTAIGISALVHLLLLILVPYRPVRPGPPPIRELIPVKMFQVPHALREQTIRTSVVKAPATEATVQNEPPVIQASAQDEEGRPIEKAPVPDRDASLVLKEAAPPVTDAKQTTEQPDGGGQGSLATLQAPAGSEPSAAAKPDRAGAEIAAYKTMLSILRDRIMQNIRYPALARARGWKGTVVVVLSLDAAGRFLQATVRQSSGYEVLDRAAEALLRKVTPVVNPLSLPVSVEIPIVYELK